jgi:hypothetical protein
MVGAVSAKVRFWMSLDVMGVTVDGLRGRVLEARQRGNMVIDMLEAVLR